MTKVNKTSAPDFSEDERKWIEQHPVWRVVFMLLRLALVPAMLAGITAYFEYRAGHTDKKAEATYQTVAPVVNDTQEQVKALSQKVELLQQLVIALARNGAPTPVAAPSPTPAPAAAPGSPLEGIGGVGVGSGRGSAGSGRVVVAPPVSHAAPKPAQAAVKAKLVEQLEQVKGRAFTPRALPPSANEAYQQQEQKTAK